MSIGGSGETGKAPLGWKAESTVPELRIFTTWEVRIPLPGQHADVSVHNVVRENG